ncbi:putative bifunctional diguanylate cyclase/phosphodiesterase [Pseudomonas saudiphocaensis]|uniref:putative bifunctional diguanylate cyclase/phosphodiesterase n=1 Tax=Pseudomonas saudiphocaensis TaxID=1499686 RepID=UPI00187D3FFA|nr:bifunctional diguanylate cyclase/phosphodiesterase [Pseudomonas saudiphocaensis]MBE7926983.1 EAL domain-containing protein [Pseudomonas saudiphocaensis]
MYRIFSCITDLHHPGFVIMAALLCVVGAGITLRLYRRAQDTRGVQRVGWCVLAAGTAGSTIWSTHFIAMLGYRPNVPIELDPGLTSLSLLVAMLGASAGLMLALLPRWRLAPAVGGAVCGLGISAMHYLGMLAYRVQGLVSWDQGYIFVSILLAASLGAFAFQLAHRPGKPKWHRHPALFLSLAIVSLHFTGMAGFGVSPVLVEHAVTNPPALQALAFAVGGVTLLIFGAGVASYLIDDSVRLESLTRFKYLAMYDGLTGLPNRESFSRHLELALSQAQKNGEQVGLLFIDLDGFKAVNDLHGHAAGDQVLQQLGQRFSALSDERIYPVRLSGDEFAVVLRLQSKAALEAFVERLQASIGEPMETSFGLFNLGASIGGAIYPQDASSKESLLSNADLAMYRAKGDLSRQVCFYEPDMDERIRLRKSLANDLRIAIEENQLQVHYQLQTDLASGRVRGYEALLRWEHPTRGDISPAEFIPLAERDTTILVLGEWVLRRACQDAASWTQPFSVAVNVSPMQFIHDDLASMVQRVLDDTGLAPERLELELTESSIFADRDKALAMLTRIKEMGVSIALDDFGTGYSSLDILRAFPFDKIKTDRSFMPTIEENPQAQAIISAVLALGRSLNIPVLAEGIETPGQLELLRNMGCAAVQGFYLGRPKPMSALIEAGQLSLLSDRLAPTPSFTA